jgi:micrococcal nuclease
VTDHRYVYRARAERVIDGDTLAATLDCGFHCYHVEVLRLVGVDTPEVVGADKAAGLRAKAFTERWVAEGGSEGWPLMVETFKGQTFGRYLATVRRCDTGESLADALRAAGLTVGGS